MDKLVMDLIYGLWDDVTWRHVANYGGSKSYDGTAAYETMVEWEVNDYRAGILISEASTSSTVGVTYR